MNKKLLERMIELKKLFKNYRAELVAEYNALSNDKVSEKNAIVRKVRKLDADYIRLRDAIKDNNEEVLNEFDREYGILFTNKEESKVDDSKNVKPVSVEKVSVPAEETSKKERTGLGKFFMGLGTGLALAGTALGVSSCVSANNTATYQENPNKEDNDEEKPFETYGKFKNAANEKQLQERAEWFYNKYVSQNKGVNAIDIDGVKNILRMTNGEFKLDRDGNTTYTGTDITDLAQDIFTISSYASLSQYGNNINYIPYAPLFEDGSLAQKGAIMLDSSMEKIVKAINENNKEDFLKYSKEWGISVVNIFEQTDFNGNYPSVFQMDSYSGYPLFKTVYANYSTAILEYSLANDINICIPYCIDYSTKEVREVPLSEIIYTINSVPNDWVAKRSGHEAEYAENGKSISQELYSFAKNYFDSKYDLEFGRSRILK